MMHHLRRFRLATTALLTALVVTGLAGQALAGTAGPSSHREWVKYYIVRPPNDGLQEYLYEIAQHTLGSGKYAVQIFDLNKGRLEPGGDRLLSASVIKPGWILVLPPNAHGPGVHYGPLPAVTATPAPTASASPRPTSRGPIMQAAIGAALIMLLLTIGLFVFGRKRTPISTPNGPSTPKHLSTFIKHRGRLAANHPIGQRTRRQLAVTAPVGSPDGGPTPAVRRADQAEHGDEETAWPGFLGLADDDEPTTAASKTTASEIARLPENPLYLEPPDATHRTEPPSASDLPDPPAPTRQAAPASEADDSAFSPAALRILGARPARQEDEDDVPPQRYQVALGDDRIEVVLAKAPATNRASRARAGKTWLAAAPYLVWAPLPYDIPDDGLAFACVGAGDEGCLFLDLAAAPGAIAIGGDPGASVRLAESLAHQLCVGSGPGEATAVVLVGGAVPEPHPAGATWVATLRDLATASPDDELDRTDIVFCELNSSEDAFVLARHVTSAQRRIIPVVLGRLPGPAWSFTAQSSPRGDLTLPTLVAARPASRS